MLSARTSFAALTTEFALQTRRVCRGRAFRVGFRKPNARNGTQLEPRLCILLFVFKLAISTLRETDGKGTVSKVDYFFDSPASFRKLEIEPKK